MDYDKLSNRMKGKLQHLKGASSTIENDVLDALEDAATEREFIKISAERLEDLKNEVENWMQNLKDGGSSDGV